MAHLLLVEDHALVAQLLGMHLQHAGHTVTVLTHGRHITAAAQAQPPDLILLDALLPGGHSIQLARRLKADPRTHPIPIVILTTLLDDRARRIGRVSGADAVLTQLTDASALVRAIGALLARAPIESIQRLRGRTLLVARDPCAADRISRRQRAHTAAGATATWPTRIAHLADTAAASLPYTV